jgi:hypothetical protein
MTHSGETHNAQEHCDVPVLEKQRRSKMERVSRCWTVSLAAEHRATRCE